MFPLLRLLVIPHKKLFWLILALLIWITAWFTFLSQSLQSITNYLDIQTKESLGGDLVIQWARPLRDDQRSKIEALLGNDFSHSASVRFFNSLSVGTGQPLLTTIVGYDDQYPLFGTLETTTNATSGVYISTSLASQVAPTTQALQIGEANFPIAGEIITMPWLGLNTFDGGRIVLMPIAQVASTQLIQTGSRVSYRHAYRIPWGASEELAKRIELLVPEQEVTSLDSARSQREQFFTQLKSVILLALCSLIILTYSGLRIVNDMLLRRLLDSLRLIRILGTTRKRLFLAWCFILISLLFIAFLLWGSLGYQAWQLLPRQQFAFHPSRDRLPYVFSCLVTMGIMAALLFSRQALFQQDNVIATSLYTMTNKKQQRWSRLVIAAVLLLALVMELGVSTRSLLLWSAVVGWLLAVYAIVYTLLMLFARLTKGWKTKQLAWWWVLRRSSQPGSPMPLILTIITSILSISGLCFLFRQSVQDYTTTFRTNEQANTFILNLREEDTTQFKTMFSWASLYDVILGRIITLDGKTLSEVLTTKKLSAGSYTREFNMTTIAQQDTVIAGKVVWSPIEQGEVSVDSRVAEALGIEIGSEITMSIVGREFSLRVVQLRRTTRNAIRPFFFFQLSPEQFVDAPRSYFSVHYFPVAERPAILKNISQQLWPHLSFIEVDAIIQQVEELLQAIGRAIILVFSSVVICGCVLLLLCFRNLAYEHSKDLQLLQTLGANASFVRQSSRAVLVYPLSLASCFAAVVVLAVVVLLRSFQDALPFVWTTIGLTLLLLLCCCIIGIIFLFFLFRRKIKY